MIIKRHQKCNRLFIIYLIKEKKYLKILKTGTLGVDKIRICFIHAVTQRSSFTDLLVQTFNFRGIGEGFEWDFNEV